MKIAILQGRNVGECHSELVEAMGNNNKLIVAFSRISLSRYFDVGTLFLSSHIHSAQCFTYNLVSITLCVLTVKVTALYCSVYILKVQ